MAHELSIKEIQSSLETLNHAIHSNRTAPYFRHLLDACGSLNADDHLEIAVYRDDPSDPQKYFSIRMQDDAFLLVGVDEAQESPDWIVSEDYLRDMANKPQKYVEHPEKLSLNWLVHRLNSSAKSVTD